MKGPRSRVLLAAIAAALCAATLAAYAPALRAGFIESFDDVDYVTGNPMVREGISREGVVWAFARWHAANWHPLTWISHMLDSEIWGLDPRGHHLTSLLLHAANATLLLLALDRMTGRTWRSAFVAALFALHPLHVESAAWVAERKDVLATLFWMSALLAWAGYARRPGAARYSLVVALHALALLSKPMPVTLPFTLLLLDFWPLGRFRLDSPSRARDARRLVVEKVPLLALSAISSVVTFRVQAAAGAMAHLEVLPMAARVANAAVAYVKYLLLAAWPSGLAPLYPYPAGGVPAWQAAAASALLAGATWVAIRAARSRPWLAFGWLWYLGTLVPVIGIVQVGRQSMADRYAYVPLVGVFVAVAWGAAEAARGIPARARAGALGTAAGAALLALALGTRAQAAIWSDGVTLFERTIAVTGDNAVAHQNLGAALALRGRLDDAMRHYREAIRIDPGYVEALNSLGGALLMRNRVEEALEPIREAVRLEPGNAEARYNLGLALAGAGRTAEAAAAYEEARRLDPSAAGPRYSLAVLALQAGRLREAEDGFRRAVELDPTMADAHLGLGLAIERRGEPREAEAHLERAARARPGDARAWRELARVRLALGDRAGAESALRGAAEAARGE